MCEHEITKAENPNIKSFNWTEVDIEFNEVCEKCGKTVAIHNAIYKREEK